MALTPEQAVDRARELHEQSQSEKQRLDDVRRYWKGRQRLPIVLPATAPTEARILARSARVNVIDLVVESLAQGLSVDGYRGATETEDAAVWGVWQANRMDARQSIIHRAVLAYGIAYAVVTPGEPVPVIRGLSPRRLTTLYDDGEPDWPAFALERAPAGPWRLYDEMSVHLLTEDSGAFTYESTSEHGAGVVPVIRYLEVQDPDWDDEPSDESYPATRGLQRQVIGQVAPLMALQDQIDIKAWDLLVAQHFSANQQRYVLGWMAPDEETKLKMSGSTIWTFGGNAQDIQVGVIQGAPLDGHLESLQASFRQVASLSQTPAHELVGQLVNLSAEALAAAEAGRDRKIADRQTTIGEAHEQTMSLAGRLAGMQLPVDAQVIWRDTSARSFAATVDALVKLVQVGVPLAEVLTLVPGLSQQDTERIKAAQPEPIPVLQEEAA